MIAAAANQGSAAECRRCPPLPPRHVEPAPYSAALKDQNTRREGSTVPDFAPATPPVYGAWLARNNRDEAILGLSSAPASLYRRAHPRLTTLSVSAEALTTENAAPRPPIVTPSLCPTSLVPAAVRAYRVVASLPRALSLDLLA